MATEGIRFLLADGELLWQLAPELGAISAAAAVHNALQTPDLVLVDLTAPQSAALQKALALLRPAP